VIRYTYGKIGDDLGATGPREIFFTIVSVSGKLLAMYFGEVKAIAFLLTTFIKSQLFLPYWGDHIQFWKKLAMTVGRPDPEKMFLQ
jgi:hypothetical protein